MWETTSECDNEILFKMTTVFAYPCLFDLKFDWTRHQLNSSDCTLKHIDFCPWHVCNVFDFVIRKDSYSNLSNFCFLSLSLLFLQALNTCVKITCYKWMPKMLHIFCTKVKVSIKLPSVSCSHSMHTLKCTDNFILQEKNYKLINLDIIFLSFAPMCTCAS